MSATARDLLAAFDALDPAEKQQVIAEILRRSAGVDGLPDETFDELAAEVFRSYEAEEVGGADRLPVRDKATTGNGH